MNKLQKKLGHEKWVINEKGQIESVVIPISDYAYLIELLEDHGLGKAMEEVEDKKVMNKKDALRYLQNV